MAVVCCQCSGIRFEYRSEVGVALGLQVVDMPLGRSESATVAEGLTPLIRNLALIQWRPLAECLSTFCKAYRRLVSTMRLIQRARQPL